MNPSESPRVTSEPLAERAEVIGLLFRYVRVLSQHFEEVAAHHNLTDMQAKLLMLLDEPRSTREAAQRLACDPSNITGMVDRLESRALLERRTDATDRRIKLLTLTSQGEGVLAQFRADLFASVPGMQQVSTENVLLLKGLLQRLLGESTPSEVAGEAGQRRLRQ